MYFSTTVKYWLELTIFVTNIVNNPFINRHVELLLPDYERLIFE